ncbi:MAG: hypothetical protein HY318_11510 [Armatimonadetes bacterium]|nr:hypothetical protein [Armatimonadota bacterium]
MASERMETDSPVPDGGVSLARNAQARAIGQLLGLVACYVALRLLVPHVVLGKSWWAVGTAFTTVVFMALSLAIVLKATEIKTGISAEVVALLLLTAWFLMTDHLKAELVSETFLMLAAVAFGKLVARMIRHTNLVLPVAVVAGLVDIWGVNLGGPVSQIATHAPKLLNKLTATIPQFSTATGAPKILTVIGVGDFAFLALFFACLHKFGMNTRGSARLAVVAMCLGMLVVTLVPGFPALPGLPFMALGIILPNWKYFTFTREEKFAMLYAGFAVVVLLAGVYFGVRSMVPPEPATY